VVRADRVVLGEWAVREEWEVRVIVAGPEEIALATAVFKAVPGVEIAAPSEAALALTAKAPSPAAAVELPAWEAPEAVVAVVRGAVAVAGDNLTRRGENT
jgi:hypothetical protein